MAILATTATEKCAISGCPRKAWDGCRPATLGLCEPHYRIPSNRTARLRKLGLLAAKDEEASVGERPKCAVCGKGEVPENATPKKLALCWNCYSDKAKREARREALGQSAGDGTGPREKRSTEADSALARKRKAQAALLELQIRAANTDVSGEAIIPLHPQASGALGTRPDMSCFVGVSFVIRVALGEDQPSAIAAELRRRADAIEAGKAS